MSWIDDWIPESLDCQPLCGRVGEIDGWLDECLWGLCEPAILRITAIGELVTALEEELAEAEPADGRAAALTAPPPVPVPLSAAGSSTPGPEHPSAQEPAPVMLSGQDLADAFGGLRYPGPPRITPPAGPATRPAPVSSSTGPALAGSLPISDLSGDDLLRMFGVTDLTTPLDPVGPILKLALVED